MTNPDQLLTELRQAIPPGPSLDRVAGWVREGRPQRRFYPLLWLSRVWRRNLS